MSSGQSNQSRPTIRFLKVTNYRALRNVELRNLTPLTVLLGPNGSGKSNLLEVLAAIFFQLEVIRVRRNFLRRCTSARSASALHRCCVSLNIIGL